MTFQLQQFNLLSNLLLVTLIAWLGGSLFWQVYAPDKQQIDRQAILQSIFKQPEQNQNKVEDIASLHLFGQAKQVVSRPKPKRVAIQAPVSRLNLKLKGVFATQPPSSALAIISSGSSSELLYGIGEQLPGGAILKEVYNDRVIIERSGHLETLKLPKQDANIKDEVEAPSYATQFDEQVLHSTPKELRTLILKDPAQLPKVLATIPQYKNGRIIGYKLKMKKYHGLLQQYGLRESDVITSINGVALNNPANGFKILQQLTNAPYLNLVVLRNGQKETLSVSLQ